LQGLLLASVAGRSKDLQQCDQEALTTWPPCTLVGCWLLLLLLLLRSCCTL
jgi:hypothetical protein